MRVGGFDKAPDWIKLGPSLLIASCVILAIRTARWSVQSQGTESQRDLEREIDHSIHLADCVLGTLLRRKASLFPAKDVAWHVPSDDDVAR